MIFKKILRMTYIQKLFFKISNFWRISVKIQPLSDVLVGEGLGHHLPDGGTLVRVPAAYLVKEHVGEVELGHPGGHRAHLERSLLGAALEHHVGIGGPGRFGKPGDQFFSSSSVEPE